MRFVILISFILSGCLGINYTRPLTKEVKYNFTNRFEGKNTGIANQVNLKGYYRYWLNDEFGRPEKIHNTNDTAFIDLVFYEDGTFIWNLWPGQGFNNYEDFFKSVINKGKTDLFYKSYYWGIYSMSNDTIKAQYLMHASPGTPWYTGESWYKIVNSKSLRVIYDVNFDKNTSKDPNKSIDHIKRATPINFMPQYNIPPPLAWLKRESFFWSNKQNWEQYIKSTDP